jgi:GT2 family glycosyltransferase
MSPFSFKPSWILLTYNRAEVVEKCFDHNLSNAGAGITEAIWVDNGSDSFEMGRLELIKDCLEIDVVIKNTQNKGVARGYNQGYVLATGSHVVITGCDRLMPKDWLSKFKRCFELIPETGIVSIYSKSQEQVPERFIGDPDVVQGIKIQECMPFEARILSRELLNKIGYLREDFGLYGYEDIEWSNRAQRVTKELGLINYTFPDMIATHIGNEGIEEFNGTEDQDYHDFKKQELVDPKKLEVFNQCVKDNFPYYNPFL